MKIAALIVTFNRLDKLKVCWNVTRSQDFTHIIIIDNCSSDGTSEWLRQQNDSRLTVLTMEKNIGGAGGFHHGAGYLAKNIACDWVAFYDDDAFPQPGLIKSFEDLACENWDAYCCRVVDANGALLRMNQPYAALPQSATSYLKKGLTSGNVNSNPRSGSGVSSFSFVGVVLKSNILFSTYHMIKDDMFIYYDDVYYSWSLVLSGYRIRYTPELTFIHDTSGSNGIIYPEWKVYYLIRNLIRSLSVFPENKRPFTKPAILLRMAKYVLLTYKQKSKKLYIRFIFLGVLDGIKNKCGRLE